MIKKTTLLLFCLTLMFGYSQDNPQWKGYFSYNKITDISQSQNEVYVSSESGLFVKNIATEDLKTINSINGLKTQTISAIYHSSSNNKTFVGNNNGLLLVINQDGSILYKNGILAELPVSPLIKKINHFTEYQNKLYISCDFGISVFDLNTLEFGDTYYVGDNGFPSKVLQTTILNGEIFTVIESQGIKKASLSNPNLVDYSQWQYLNPYSWNGIVSFNNMIIGIHSSTNLYSFNGFNVNLIASINQTGLDLRVSGNYLIATTLNHVFVFNQNLQQIAHIQSSQYTKKTVTFTCATVLNNILYIGTNETGIISTPVSSSTNFEIILPNGPEKNNIFRLKKSATQLWALYGRYNVDYNPYDPPNGLGQFPISYYSNDKGWNIIPYSDIFEAKSLSNIAINPNNPDQLFVSSCFSGLLKIDGTTPTQLYGISTNGLESIATNPPNPNFETRVNGPAFDKNGNLWMTNNFITKGLKVLKSSGQWQSYDMSPISDYASTANYGILVVDKNNTKWIPTLQDGLLAFNENYPTKSTAIKSSTNGNLPDTNVRCLAIDNKNQLWIGTIRGLRIIQNVDSFLTDTDLQTKAIIILENDLAQELFYEQFILDITVDGANRKWVSIADSGVYLVSPNGQQTIYHFTKDNSPLPSDNVNDIEIDSVTGEVFFATDKGLVSFKGTATKASDDLNNVYVYPNPVRPEFNGTVKISGLTNKAIVKITDIEGNLVYETTSEGGTIEWDTTAFGKYKVASGVYMILISGEDGAETKVKKVMIIR